MKRSKKGRRPADGRRSPQQGFGRWISIEAFEPEDRPARYVVMRSFWIMVVLAGTSAAVPAHAETNTHLAKECRGLALKAHPATLPNIPAVVNLRDDYYKLCVTRRGKMDPELSNPP
jgi:hypothetical protein